ncbi:MAG: hypothetical protein OXU78_05165, partial [Deltaproteobacteria bacterium]|nr:hypothetical protein [Deltaproteobacteria bacterium]
ERLRTAVKINPRDVMAHVEIITALLMLGRVAESIDAADEARRQNPRAGIFYLYMGCVCKVKGMEKEAQKMFDIALHYDPKLVLPE